MKKLLSILSIFCLLSFPLASSAQIRLEKNNHDDLIELDTTSHDKYILEDGTRPFSAKIFFTPSSFISITAGGGITRTNAIMLVQGDGGAVDITADPQIAAGSNGEMIIVIGGSDVNTVKLDNGTGLALAGGISFTMGLKDNIIFIYNQTASEWIEISRSDL